VSVTNADAPGRPPRSIGLADAAVGIRFKNDLPFMHIDFTLGQRSPGRDSSRFLLSFIALVLIAAMPGCRKQTPAGEAQPSESQAAPAKTGPPDAATDARAPEAREAATAPPSAQAQSSATDPGLQKFEQGSGLVLPAGAAALSHGDGGVPDASVGFYEWVIFSPNPVVLPAHSGGSQIANLPLPQTVGYVEAKMGGEKIEAPQTACSAKWEANGFEFNATWIRGQKGDYLMVQQFRKR
jgi:hypothetical protein